MPKRSSCAHQFLFSRHDRAAVQKGYVIMTSLDPRVRSGVGKPPRSSSLSERRAWSTVVVAALAVQSAAWVASSPARATDATPNIEANDVAVPPLPVGIGAGSEVPAESLPGRLSLAQAEDIALKNQPTLRQARANTDAAQGRVEQARAGYLPQVAFNAGYELTTSNPAPRPGAGPLGATMPSLSGSTYNYFNFGLTGSQLIYDFGLTSNRWRAAEANHDSVEASENTSLTQLVANVRKAYFQTRAQQDLVTVGEESVRDQKRHVQQVESYVKVGLKAEIDLASVQTDLANAEVQLITATNNVRLAKAQLAQSMGIMTHGEYQLTDADLAAPPDEDAPLDTLVDDAVRARPEMATLIQQRRGQALTLASDRGGYGPSLGATGSLTEVGASSSQSGPTAALGNLVPNGFLGLSLSWGLFQGGLTKGQVHEASATLRALDAQVDILRLQIRVDVEQAQLSVQSAKATAGAADKALTNARKQHELAEARYAHGLGNIIELNDAQVTYINAEAQLVQTRYGILIARAQLLGALGRR